jgi:AhpD family alkylhydroperoxidase
MEGDTIITERDTEIINLAVSMAAGCQPCMKYHLRKSKDAGLSEKKIHDIVNLAEELYIRAIQIMKLRALSFGKKHPTEGTGFPVRCESRTELLVGLAVSYTVNNTDLCEGYLQYARQSDMNDSEISRIRGISDFIHSKARAHMDLLIEGTGIKNRDREKDEGKCGCGC